MNWIPTLGPIGIGLLATVPIGIVLLYFLKLRREPVQVPSTFLWRATIEDLHVNSLLQRLRRSLLLLLQLLAVALAAIALFRPGIRGESRSTDRSIFLIDTSASMDADDTEANRTRLEKAKELVGDRIEQMLDGEVGMLIAFDDRAQTMQSFTSDRSRLRAALGAVQPSSRTTDILGALRAADGLANPRRTSQVGDTNDVQVADAKPADLMIFSDGGFDPVTEFNLGNLVPQYVPIGSSDATNAAITALSAQRNVERPGSVEVFGTVANLGAGRIETTATLRGDGSFLDAQTVALEPGEQTGLSFRLETEEASLLELGIDLDDALALDNTAYTSLAPLRSVDVLLVTPGNAPLELALSTPKVAGICSTEIVGPDYLSTEMYAERSRSGQLDLIIFDRCAPPELPTSSTFFIGRLPPQTSDAGSLPTPPPTGETGDRSEDDAASDPAADDPASRTFVGSAGEDKGWAFTGSSTPFSIVDVNRAHPLMQYLELYSLLIVEGRPLRGPVGSDVLIDSDVGPMMVVAPRDGYQDLVLGFELLSEANGSTQINTNWYAERSWPVFLLNILRSLAGAAEAGGADSYRPGTTVRIRLPARIDEVTIERVDGDGEYSYRPGPDGVIEFLETERPGNYRVRSGQRTLQTFSINLFDRGESRVAVQPEVEIGYEAVEGQTGGEETRHEYWRLALLAMLGLLGLEWFLFGKRVS